MALAITGTGNGSLNNLALSANTGTIVDTGRAGGIIQVVQATTSTPVSITSSTFTDTGLSASITPTSSSNKILVMVNQPLQASRSVAPAASGIKLLRGSTVLLSPVQNTSGPFEFYSEPTNFFVIRATINYLDSPATTSSTTYKTQGRPYFTSSSGAVQFQPGSTVNATSTITLMEVVA